MTKPPIDRTLSGAFLVAAALAAAPGTASTAELWTGPTVTFTKPNGADPSLAENRDCITENVCLTRAAVRQAKGLYNAVDESAYVEGDVFTPSPSPADTEWASGRISDGVATLTFSAWTTWAQSFGQTTDIVGQDAVVHLISDDIYIDIRFTSWTSGQEVDGEAGGGFSYERSTAPVTSDTAQVPVPTLALALLGLGLAGIARRRPRA